MPKNLVIVESPAKAKTIQKYLGKDYKVESSYGHIVDLPKKDMGIDIENDFQPQYVVSPDKKEVVNRLKKEAKTADTVWLASDEDREGEAIAWHLFNELDLKKENTKRIVFHEITEKAIKNAIDNPRDIDIDLVNAQQARRVLDRIVGFEVSPVLWRKVKPGLSAGRVQSVAVRLLVEREKEILKFEPQSSYKFTGLFNTEKNKSFNSNLTKDFDEAGDALSFLESCKEAQFKVASVEKRPGSRKPSAPFTTSTLQQEASRKLGYSVSQTMRVAQQLYENGFITYMRTDSVNLSEEALKAAAQVIGTNYGDNYIETRKYSTKSKGAQEAHEAIRPTNLSAQEAGMDNSQRRLYNLIWKRTVASQMANAKLERTTIKIENNKNEYIFQTKGEVILFDGFLKLYVESSDDESSEEQEGLLPKMEKGETVIAKTITGTQKFTKHPPRYTEASLVRKLEELGIGRPSTYAPTISTIQKRGYVEVVNLDGEERDYEVMVLKNGIIDLSKQKETYGADRKKLRPTDTGIVVNDFLVNNFPTFMDYDFTARAEDEFDEIAEGKEFWSERIGEFYSWFHPNVEEVKENADRATGERLLGKDPETGKNVYARIGRYGPMIQIGEVEDEEKPKFASLNPNQNILTITLDEALKLFELPKNLGDYEGKPVEVNVGRYGPYIKYDEKFISLDKGEDPNEVSLERAEELIKAKQLADAPIATYEGKDVTKGVGRFGPFIKWDGMFINVNKKYDFDSLSQSDIKELIEAKKKKEAEKVVKEFPEEGIRIEKARWKRHHIIQGKTKVEVPKEVDVENMTLEEAKKRLESAAPKKKTTAKKKTTTKRKTTKKSTPKK